MHPVKEAPWSFREPGNRKYDTTQPRRYGKRLQPEQLWTTCCGLVTQKLEGRGFRLRIPSMEGARSGRAILGCLGFWRSHEAVIQASGGHSALCRPSGGHMIVRRTTSAGAP